MDQIKTGKLLCALRKEKGMTQRQLAEKLGLLPKTVSKWETGKGFPDVSFVCKLSEILGVSTDALLCGDCTNNKTEAGNLKKMRFYVCPGCGCILQGIGNAQVTCCGKTLKASTVKQADAAHTPRISVVEDEYYIEFEHEMTKSHYLMFGAAVSSDALLWVRLYPEQTCALRIPIRGTDELYYYCNRHGLFSCRLK